MTMKILICFALIIGLSSAIKYANLINEEWEDFKSHHNKVYSDASEERSRFKIYLNNRFKIAKQNKALHSTGSSSYELGINEYSDMLHSEFVRTMNGFKQAPPVSKNPFYNFRFKAIEQPATFIVPENLNLPTSIDWRTKNAVTEVKNQGRCGSCWSFSATGALESQTYRKTGRLVSLSEQNLIDCSKSYGNGGCQGGYVDRSYQYIKDNAGINSESIYPYEGIDTNQCRFRRQNVAATDTGFVFIRQYDENELMKAVASVGPISVAIDASQSTFHYYRKGIYYEPNCSSTNLDHAVLVVGYGTDVNTNMDFWIVKNSWGLSWGENGYIKMARNMKNNCGIASSACYPLV